MKHLLNSLYVLTPDLYLTLDGENIVSMQKGKEAGRFPLHTLERILCFSYAGASPALMGACARRGVDLCFFSPQGRFLARSVGAEYGNVLLRQEQYRIADNDARSCAVARRFILGKVYNARWILERATRDHPQRVPVDRLKHASGLMGGALTVIESCPSADELRGLEGSASQQYFDCFDALILQQKETFFFHGRSRRPPMDRMNAALSFAYVLLAGDCAAALDGVGLDPYVGFMHRPRPGRTSLALDLIEELRGVFADRFVLSAVNQKILRPEHFEVQESGAVLLNDEGRKVFLKAWQSKKLEIITHPYLGEKMPWGLVPHIQALLLARVIRGDLDGYPPFFWK